MSLSKRIEEYIKRLLAEDDAVELQRNELAELFNCVPSQINYVLSTRFTPIQGYIIESRRGGGGFLRIVKLSWNGQEDNEAREMFHSLGNSIDQWEAEGLLRRLREDGIITRREYYILKAVLSRDTLQIELPQRDEIRARIIQAALMALNRNDI
jgi:transcriptional regulator CtsR